MLTKLLEDARNLVAALPTLEAAIAAVNDDLSGGKIDAKQLATDATALSEAAGDVQGDIEALKADLDALPQAEAPNKLGEVIKALQADYDGMGDKGSAEGTRLQNLICAAIPIYNIFATMQGWPTFPIPAFCGTKGGEN